MEKSKLKDNFDSIMAYMNNGLSNESTLIETYPLITKLCLMKNPDKINNMLEHMHEEEVLTTRPHPGLNDTINICKTSIKPLIENMSVEKEVVVKTMG